MSTPKTAKQFVVTYGKALIGRKVFTVAIGDYPGGVATVMRLGDDPNAPDIVLIVQPEGQDEIGVFDYEPISFAHKRPPLCHTLYHPHLGNGVYKDTCPECGYKKENK